MIYAVIGQAKTATSVLLSLVVFHESLSPRSIFGLSLSLMVALTLAAVEAFENEKTSAKLFGYDILNARKYLFKYTIALIPPMRTLASGENAILKTTSYASKPSPGRILG